MIGVRVVIYLQLIDKKNHLYPGCVSIGTACKNQ